jgi:uncharacterized membrane protein
MPRMILFVASLAMSVGLCGNAHATHWSVCNHTAEHLNVAIAFVDNENSTMIEGWHELGACGGCAVVLNFDRTQRENVWLFAKNNNNVSRFHSANPRLCIFDGQAFRHRNVPGEHCQGGGRVVGFDTLHFPDQSINHTTNLTGSPDGRHCID